MTTREVRCTHCGALNRVPRYSVRRIPWCGTCRCALPESKGVQLLRKLYQDRIQILGAVLVLGGIVYLGAPSTTERSSPRLEPLAYLPSPPTLPEALPSLDLDTLSRKVAPIGPLPGPTCQFIPDNGRVLSLNARSGEHKIEIENGTAGNAIIKVRDATTGRVSVSFFVALGRTASFDRLPDGTYQVQYAIGQALAADCHSFVHTEAADEFPGPDNFSTRYTSGAIVYQVGTYTLYSVPDGNVRPHAISLEQFNAE